MSNGLRAIVNRRNDAVNESGDIRISTTQDNGWVVLSVADSGCGMSQDFIRENLFRHFRVRSVAKEQTKLHLPLRMEIGRDRPLERPLVRLFHW